MDGILMVSCLNQMNCHKKVIISHKSTTNQGSINSYEPAKFPFNKVGCLEGTHGTPLFTLSKVPSIHPRSPQSTSGRGQFQCHGVPNLFGVACCLCVLIFLQT